MFFLIVQRKKKTIGTRPNSWTLQKEILDVSIHTSTVWFWLNRESRWSETSPGRRSRFASKLSMVRFSRGVKANWFEPVLKSHTFCSEGHYGKYCFGSLGALATLT